jgi:[ribosomal protein S18]-alanine N-acetyltransferase
MSNSQITQFNGAEAAPILAQMHALCFDKPWSESDFKALLTLPANNAIILNKDSNPAGFCLLQALGGEAEILSIGILPNWQRRALGADLLRHAIEALRDKNIDRLFLEVSNSNNAARALYEKLEFKQIGLRKNYYREKSGPQDALVLELKL